jgi:hypothetical protein
MKRYVLTALLALALPLTALADTVDFTNNNGTLAGSAVSLSLQSTITVIDGFGPRVAGPNLGTLSFTTGPFNAGGNLVTGGSYSAVGSTFTIALNAPENGMPAGVVFAGSFTSDVSWTPVPNQAGFYTIEGSIKGTWWNGTVANGDFTQQVYLVNFNGTNTSFTGTLGSGDTFIPIPEPGTLGLLGTGLVGLAGLVRKTLKV